MLEIIVFDESQAIVSFLGRSTDNVVLTTTEATINTRTEGKPEQWIFNMSTLLSAMKILSLLLSKRDFLIALLSEKILVEAGVIL